MTYGHHDTSMYSSWFDIDVLLFYERVCPKVNGTTRQEFDLTHYDIVVFITGTWFGFFVLCYINICGLFKATAIPGKEFPYVSKWNLDRIWDVCL